jgi:hypothetical protein
MGKKKRIRQRKSNQGIAKLRQTLESDARFRGNVVITDTKPGMAKLSELLLQLTAPSVASFDSPDGNTLNI